MANSPIGSKELHNDVPAIWNTDGTLRTPAGGSVSVISVVSSAAPSNADGRPDGTIYFQTV